MAFTDRLKHAWNAFVSNKDPTIISGGTYGRRIDRPRFSRGNERTIVTAVYNRIAMDVASVNIEHVRLDEQKRFLEVIDSGLNNCLTLEANIDQTSRAFIQDVVISMMDEGCVAIVPTETSSSPVNSNAYDVLKMRTAKIIEWFPQHVKVRCYNEDTGKHQDLTLPKKMVGIIENPLYAVINEPNSTMNRLIRKLALLDMVDESNSSGKLDLIIQLPYIVKSTTKKEQAEARRKQIEDQLANSKYGVAYTDGTEKITQLNRAVENQLFSQVEYYTNLLYSQLGITTGILDGSANESTMLNYNNRTIEPILSAITMEMKRKFLSKTARSQGQSIMFFRDPFKLVPLNDMAEIADKFTRNEIMTSNEIRQVVGMRPADDPKADELRNSNINHPDEQMEVPEYQNEDEYPMEEPLY